MTVDPSDPLFAALAGQEPEEIRHGYLAVPRPGQALGIGTTAPIIGTPMADRGDGLILPIRGSGAQMARMASRYMTYDVLFGHRLGAQRVGEMLQRHSREALLTAGAQLLAHLQEKHPTNREANESLIEPLRPDVRRKAQALLNDGWLFLAPQAIVGVMKLALLGDDEQVADPDTAFADFVLVTLDLAAELGNDEPPADEPRWPGTTLPESLAMDIIQNQLFNHTINLGSELARWRRGRDLAVAYDHYAAMQFDAVFEEATGCKPEVLFEVGLSAILKLREEKTVRLDPVIFNQLEYAPGEVAAAVDLVATDMDHLQELVVQEYEESGIDWAANSLRRYPIVRCQDGKLLVLVPQFLIQRVCGSGFHWEVLNELNGRRRRATGVAKSEAKQLIGSFGVFTGHAAEEYAADRLERIVPNHGGLAKQLWREQDLQQIWPDEKCCDFLIDGGHAWVAMDAVNHAITAKAAAAGSVAALQQDLEYIIDEKAVQLDATIGRLIESGGSLPGQPAPHLRPRYHPVIVAAAGFPWSPIMAAAVHERLREKGLLQHDLIDPLTVITTQELEFLEHAVANGRVALVEMLDHRTQTHQVEVPVDMYLFGRASLQLPASLIEPLNVAFNHLAHALGLGEFRSESSDQEDVGD